MPKPTVDVAIPTHGEARHLAQAIASVLAQSHDALRLTVSDNSPGGGPAARIVDAFRHDGRLRHVVTGGVPAADNWTRCIRTGEAPYVALLPHDELWDRDFLARRVAFLERHSQCAYVFSACRIIDGDGRLTAARAHRLREGVHHPREIVPLLYDENHIPTCAILVRRSAYEAVGCQFLDAYRMGMDWEMWLRMAVRFPVGYLAERDNAGRVHAESVSAASRHWGLMHLAMIARADELIARDMPGFDLSPAQRSRRLAGALRKAALDALDEDDLAAARRLLAAAVRAEPGSLAGAQGLAALAGALGGRPARRAVTWLRDLESSVQVRGRLGEMVMGMHAAR
jgi:glycosyltransferase involved in cell wall biosynthesis